MTSNRNPVKQFFITYPQSGTVTKYEFRDALLRFEPDYYTISEERHKDGNPHLHAVIRTKNKFSKAFIIKYLKEKYPDSYKRIDIQPVRSIKHSLQYLSKEDKSPLTSGEYKDNRDPIKNNLNKLAIDFGCTNMEELLSTHGIWISFLTKAKASIKAFIADYMYSTGIRSMDEVFASLSFLDFVQQKMLLDLLDLSSHFVFSSKSRDDITKILNKLNLTYD